MRNSQCSLSAALAFGAVLMAPVTAAPILYSNFPAGAVPETIVPVPGGFGGFNGYFVVDPTTNTATDAPSKIWQIPATAGAPINIASNTFNLRSGMFLPSGFGTFGGDFAVGGFNGNTVVGVDPSNQFGGVFAYDSSLGQHTLYAAGNFDAGAMIMAPANFGSVGGELLVNYTGPNAGIAVFNSSYARGADQFTTSAFAPFGLAFAPATFGGSGGMLFFDSDRTGDIWVNDGNGHNSIFTTLPFSSNHPLRYIGFAPSAFPTYGGDLIVDMAGSSFGANDGALLFVNSSGAIVGELLGINPRGFTFINGGTTMILNNTDPGVLTAVSTDVTPTPEPGSLWLAGLVLAAGVWARRGRTGC